MALEPSASDDGWNKVSEIWLDNDGKREKIDEGREGEVFTKECDKNRRTWKESPTAALSSSDGVTSVLTAHMFYIVRLNSISKPSQIANLWRKVTLAF